MATEIEQYIRAAAIQRGIDPDIAVRVAKSEGGVSDPVRQSDFVKNGVREPSYGPFQLYMGGGLGNDALKAGIDPRDPGQWQQGVDFALDQAKKLGWSPWYGAAKVGVGPRDGIGSQIAAQKAAPPQASGTPAPPLPAPRQVQDHPIASMAPTPAPMAPQGMSEQMMSVLGSMVPQTPQPQFQPVEMRGPSPEQATALSNFIQALKSRLPGVV
jgi:hypothetical protein